MAPQREPLERHVAHVTTVRQAGGEAPSAWVALHDRWVSYSELKTPVEDALVAAVLSGKGDLPTLRAASYAECVVGQPQFDVNRRVAEAVFEQLVELYRPVARKNYQTIAGRFDMVATEFAAAASAVDADAEAEAIIKGSEQERNAWAEIPLIAGRLDQLQGPLRAACELAGKSTKPREMQIALCVDPEGAHRRHIWDAYENPGGGRGGRWAAIIKCGAAIRACDLDALQPYRRPAALIERMKEVNGILIREVTDPEDTPKPGSQQAVSA
jgi:hypothetical protein